jgi:hypothetical protein
MREELNALRTRVAGLEGRLADLSQTVDRLVARTSSSFGAPLGINHAAACRMYEGDEFDTDTE